MFRVQAQLRDGRSINQRVPGVTTVPEAVTWLQGKLEAFKLDFGKEVTELRVRALPKAEAYEFRLIDARPKKDRPAKPEKKPVK